MGRLIKKKSFGRNVQVRLYYFQDGYRIYAWRRDNNKGKDSWVESRATSYAIRNKEEALKELDEYKSINQILSLHPVLRDKGTSMSASFPYKLEK